MKIIESCEGMRAYTQSLKDQNKIISEIDTYGDLHQGHLELIQEAKKHSDHIILTVDGTTNYASDEAITAENKEIYRKTLLNIDIKFCEDAQVDTFCYYPNKDFWGYYDVSKTNDTLKKFMSRPYVEYIMQIWPKQLEACKADVAVLGQKDFYYEVLIKHFIEEAGLSTKVIRIPIYRDQDGLPTSSRNKHLSVGQRRRAAYICKQLQDISSWSPPSAEDIKTYLELAASNARCLLPQIDICSMTTLEPVSQVDQETIIAICFVVGEVVLQDNIIVKPE
mgnify:CR=1 FL=1|jgi:pantoate--beta-alanine ligase|tara:strand:- start:643 stop:1479 length:837 start_codon:yes stop_codon:yes gene_type:complete